VSGLRGVDRVLRELAGTVEIRCIPSVPGAELNWYKNDKELTDGDQYTFSHENSSMTIKKVGYEDLGIYECREDGQSVDEKKTANVTILSVPFVRPGVEKSFNKSPGSSIELECRVYGHPMPVVTWYVVDLLDGTEKIVVPDETRVVLRNLSAINSQLTINDLKYEDYKIYKCNASNVYGTDTWDILVRVKSGWRAIYPISLIGIQLVILAVIIFFYERRKKKEMEVEKRREAEFNKSHPVDGGRSDGLRKRISS